MARKVSRRLCNPVRGMGVGVDDIFLNFSIFTFILTPISNCMLNYNWVPRFDKHSAVYLYA